MNYTDFCIVLSSDLKYVPYTAVAIQSLIENAGKERYCVFILHSEITEKYIRVLKSMENQNISINFINISDKSVGLEKYTAHSAQWPKEILYRLFVPFLKPIIKYEKILYIDGDVVLLDDPAHIFMLDMKDNLVAAVKDQDYPFFKEKRKKFIQNVLNMQPEEYFNSGVLLFNCAQMRKENFIDSAFKFLEKTPNLPFPDQDVLNALTYKRVYFLEPYYNTQMHVLKRNGRNDHEKEIQTNWENEIYKNAKVIHYSATDKPWTQNQGAAEDTFFWKYARKSPFYEYIIQNVSRCPCVFDYLLMRCKYIMFFLMLMITTGNLRMKYKKRSNALHNKVRLIKKKRENML
jgi:lipopolysaccharide biosynthesis glycosyltransferase